MITLSSIPLFRRGYRLQWESAQDCHVILYPEGLARLNESAATILQLVNNNNTMADIIDQLKLRFPDADDLPSDVLDFMQTAVNQKWILIRNES